MPVNDLFYPINVRTVDSNFVDNNSLLAGNSSSNNNNSRSNNNNKNYESDDEGNNKRNIIAVATSRNSNSNSNNINKHTHRFSMYERDLSKSNNSKIKNWLKTSREHDFARMRVIKGIEDKQRYSYNIKNSIDNIKPPSSNIRKSVDDGNNYDNENNNNDRPPSVSSHSSEIDRTPLKDVGNNNTNNNGDTKSVKAKATPPRSNSIDTVNSKRNESSFESPLKKISSNSRQRNKVSPVNSETGNTPIKSIVTSPSKSRSPSNHNNKALTRLARSPSVSSVSSTDRSPRLYRHQSISKQPPPPPNKVEHSSKSDLTIDTKNEKVGFFGQIKNSIKSKLMKHSTTHKVIKKTDNKPDPQLIIDNSRSTSEIDISKDKRKSTSFNYHTKKAREMLNNSSKSPDKPLNRNNSNSRTQLGSESFDRIDGDTTVSELERSTENIYSQQTFVTSASTTKTLNTRVSKASLNNIHYEMMARNNYQPPLHPRNGNTTQNSNDLERSVQFSDYDNDNSEFEKSTENIYAQTIINSASTTRTFNTFNTRTSKISNKTHDTISTINGGGGGDYLKIDKRAPNKRYLQLSNAAATSNHHKMNQNNRYSNLQQYYPDILKIESESLKNKARREQQHKVVIEVNSKNNHKNHEDTNRKSQVNGDSSKYTDSRAKSNNDQSSPLANGSGGMNGSGLLSENGQKMPKTPVSSESNKFENQLTSASEFYLIQPKHHKGALQHFDDDTRSEISYSSTTSRPLTSHSSRKHSNQADRDKILIPDAELIYDPFEQRKIIDTDGIDEEVTFKLDELPKDDAFFEERKYVNEAKLFHDLFIESPTGERTGNSSIVDFHKRPLSTIEENDYDEVADAIEFSKMQKSRSLWETENLRQKQAAFRPKFSKSRDLKTQLNQINENDEEYSNNNSGNSRKQLKIVITNGSNSGSSGGGGGNDKKRILPPTKNEISSRDKAQLFVEEKFSDRYLSTVHHGTKQISKLNGENRRSDSFDYSEYNEDATSGTTIRITSAKSIASRSDHMSIMSETSHKESIKSKGTGSKDKAAVKIEMKKQHSNKTTTVDNDKYKRKSDETKSNTSKAKIYVDASQFVESSKQQQTTNTQQVNFKLNNNNNTPTKTTSRQTPEYTIKEHHNIDVSSPLSTLSSSNSKLREMSNSALSDINEKNRLTQKSMTPIHFQ